jgi:DNA (cytosine-5)-methyltransferase 1
MRAHRSLDALVPILLQRGVIVTAATLNSGGNDGGFRTEPGEHLVAFDPTQLTSIHNRANPRPGDPAPTLPVSSDPLLLADVADPISASEGRTYTHEGRNNFRLHNVVSGIRRLTPLECERLQHFPDGWTCLCQPLAAYAADPDGTALACRCPDSPRYRAMGNAVTTSVVEWIGRRLAVQKGAPCDD